MWGRIREHKRVSELSPTVGEQMGHSSQCPGAHTWCQVSTLVPEGQTIPPTEHHHPSLLLRKRGTGRGKRGDQGTADRIPQKGPWLV